MQWNTLEIPLDCDWQCTLMPTSEYCSPSGDSLRFVRDKEERKQIEDDAKDFDRYFRPCWDLRTNTGGQALREIQAYVSNALNIAHWNLPTDNVGIERVLREAVEDGRLVPVIHRDRHSALGRVHSPSPAPLRWTSSGGGGSSVRATSWPSYGSSSMFNGGPILSGPYDPVNQQAQLIAARAAMSGSSDDGSGLLGVAIAAAGALAGTDDDDTDSADISAADDDADTSTPLGDAQPFEYSEDAVSGDAEQDAGVFLTPGEETECETQYDAAMTQCSAYWAMSPSSWGMCKSVAMQQCANCLRDL